MGQWCCKEKKTNRDLILIQVDRLLRCAKDSLYAAAKGSYLDKESTEALLDSACQSTKAANVLLGQYHAEEEEEDDKDK